MFDEQVEVGTVILSDVLEPDVFDCLQSLDWVKAFDGDTAETFRKG